MTDSQPSSTVTTQSEATGTSIELTDFCLSAGGKSLLKDASAQFPAGELTLVLGCSGVGKSLLMRILAGLIDRDHDAIRYTGDIRFQTDAGAAKDS